MSVVKTKRLPVRKNALVAVAAAAAWAALVFAVIWPWVYRFDRSDPFLTLLAHLSAAIWWAALLWSLHHLAFQLLGLFIRPNSRFPRPYEPDVAILYTTCDDFNRTCCLSCIEQQYPNARVLICDDSRTEEYRKLVKEFCEEHAERCLLVRRTGTAGFKAGNLNHAIRRHVNEDWVLLVDADQVLPPDYLRQLAGMVPAETARVAFVQGAHEAEINEQSSYLQRALAPGARFFCHRDMAVRESFGFVPMLGHGALVSMPAWRACGGFPEIVSEDFAFALEAVNRGMRGTYVHDVTSYEAFPYDFPAFMIRIRKYAAGTAELFRNLLGSFLRGPAALVEKWDLVMMLGWYVLMPLVTLNGFLAAYVCHRYWTETIPHLHPVLPYLYTWLVLTAFALCISVSDRFWTAVDFYFWSAAVFTAAMPAAGFAFLKHLFVPAVFHRTPKNGASGALTLRETAPVVALGSVAVALALVWRSPFSPVLVGQGVAYLSYPLYSHLSSDSALGKLARLLVYLPGTMLLLAILAAWKWAYL